MSNPDPQIKITSFTQISLNKPKPPTRPSRGEYVLNIVLFSPSKTLKFLDNCIRDINQNNNVHIVKCNNVTKLGYSLDSCKVGVRTICITDVQMDQETIQKIATNQTLLKNKDNFACWVYANAVEGVRAQFFHESEIQLITCDQEKMIEQLRKQYEQVRAKLGQFNSTTTIKSKDHVDMNIKLQIEDSPKKKVLNQESFYSSRDIGLDNGVPGVGTYNVRVQPTMKKQQTAVFSKSKK